MFITFEGIEGVGKSTHLHFMAELFRKAGHSVLITREPGGTPMGEEIRDILLAHRNERVAPMTELLLMFAARAQHVDTVIAPALAAGHWVLCDRFTDATYAYQGGGRGLSMDQIEALENLVLGNFRPNYTVLLDAPAEIGLSRIKLRGATDRIEQEKIDFFERVRSAYLARAKIHSNRFRMIDAKIPLLEVEKLVLKLGEEILGNTV